MSRYSFVNSPDNFEAILTVKLSVMKEGIPVHFEDFFQLLVINLQTIKLEAWDRFDS